MATQAEIKERLESLKEYLNQYKLGAFWKNSTNAIAEMKEQWFFNYPTTRMFERDLHKLREQGFLDIIVENVVADYINPKNQKVVVRRPKKRTIFFKPSGWDAEHAYHLCCYWYYRYENIRDKDGEKSDWYELFRPRGKKPFAIVHKEDVLGRINWECRKFQKKHPFVIAQYPLKQLFTDVKAPNVNELLNKRNNN